MADNNVKEKLSTMKGNLKRLQDNYNQNKGAYNAKIKMLKDEFGYDSMEEAQTALEKMKKKTVVLQKRLKESIEEFEEKYSDLLEAQ